MPNRKAVRQSISPYRLHTKKFTTPGKTLPEETLKDGSIKFQIEGFASTEAMDGSGDVVKVDGIQTDRYMLNPTIKRGHKRGEENNVGITKEIYPAEEDGVRGLYIKADIILNPEIAGHKELIHGLRHGLINGFSIGFGVDPKDCTIDEATGANVINKIELYEISLVDIPSNPLTVRKFVDMIVNGKEMEQEEEQENENEEEADTEVKEEESTENKEDEGKEQEEKDHPCGPSGHDEDEPHEDAVVEGEVKEEEKKEEEATPVVEENKDEAGTEEGTEEQPAEGEKACGTGGKRPKRAKVEGEKLSEDEKSIIESVKLEEMKSKAVGISELAVGDVILYRSMYEGEEGETIIYPGLEHNPMMGRIIEIRTEGEVMVWDGVETIDPNNPLITMREVMEVNGALIDKAYVCTRELDEMLVEGKRTPASTEGQGGIEVKETEATENTNQEATSTEIVGGGENGAGGEEPETVVTENDDTKEDEATEEGKDEEVAEGEKSVAKVEVKVTEMKEFQDLTKALNDLTNDYKELEDMFAKMLEVNKELLDKDEKSAETIKSLTAQVEKAKKFKLHSGFSFDNKSEGGTIGRIVKEIRH